MSVPLTVLGWNLDGWHTITDDQLALIGSCDAQILLAQEVTPASLDRLRAAGWRASAALEQVPEDHTERAGSRPRFGCAVLARGSVNLGAGTVLSAAPSPARTLAVDATIAGRPVHLVSAALPPGSMWGQASKVGQARHLADHLGSRSAPMLLGMDRNGPRFEHWDPERTVWWREDDPAFFAPDAAHGLTDVLRRHYDDHPDAAAEARRRFPEGPLAVSYLERRADPPVPRRYDVLLASHHFHVDEVAYDHDGAVAAGSDHALVRARLTLT